MPVITHSSSEQASRSMRSAWIEIEGLPDVETPEPVALHAERVD